MKRLLYLVFALALALWAQRWLTSGGQLLDAGIFFVLASLIFVVWSQAPKPWPVLAPRRPGTPVGLFLVVLGLGLAGMAIVLFWRDLQSTAGLWLWLAAIPLYLAGAWQEGQDGAETPGHGDAVRPALARVPQALISLPPRTRAFVASLPAGTRWEIALLVVILLFAAFTRFYQLDAMPNGCQSDECNNGLDAVSWLQGAPYTAYAETNEGQATFFTYLLSLSFRLFGIGVVQMRVVSACIGVLTVLAFYLLARDLVDRRIALAATGLLAGARWHITFSRIIYELILMPLAEVLLFYFFLRALRRGRRRDWALTGLVLGGGMHTYTAWRVIPFLIGLYLVYWLITHRHRWRRDLEGIAWLAGGALVALIPLGVYIVQKWNVFLSRIQHISVFQEIEQAKSYEPLWSNLRKTLLMFNYQGDAAGLNNLPGAPLLPFDVRSAGAFMSRVPESWILAALVGVLFVLGAVYALRYSAHPVPFLLVVAFLFVGSVAVLSVAHEAPTARRPIGLVPVVFLLVALALEQFWLAFQNAWRNQGGRVFNTILGIAVAGACLGGADTYFNVQAKNQSVYIAYSGVEAAVGEFVGALPEKTRVYLVPAFYNHSAVKLIGGRRETRMLNMVQDLPLRDDPGVDVVYIIQAVDQQLTTLFRQTYPQGQLVEHRDPFGRLYFLAYRVSGEQVAATRGLAGTYYQGDRWEAGPVASQRRDGPLSFDWQTKPPGPLPFSATWSGSLLVPAFGTYRFGAELSPASQFSLTIAGVTVLDPAAGRLEGETRLVAGFHQVTMRYRSTETLGRLTVTWEGPDGVREPIPLNALYAIAAPVNGLVGYYYRNIDWSGTPALIEKDTLIFPNDPFGERFSTTWKGR